MWSAHLSFMGTQITDAGLVHLRGLTNLRLLEVTFTRVTNAGLVHLPGLTSLRRLYLANAQTTEDGRARLRQALPDCEITPRP